MTPSWRPTKRCETSTRTPSTSRRTRTRARPNFPPTRPTRPAPSVPRLPRGNGEAGHLAPPFSAAYTPGQHQRDAFERHASHQVAGFLAGWTTDPGEYGELPRHARNGTNPRRVCRP